MKAITEERMLHDPILHGAVQRGRNAGLCERDIFESLVHMLLDMKDDALRKQLDQACNSTAGFTMPLSGFSDD